MSLKLKVDLAVLGSRPLQNLLFGMLFRICRLLEGLWYEGRRFECAPSDQMRLGVYVGKDSRVQKIVSAMYYDTQHGDHTFLSLSLTHSLSLSLSLCAFVCARLLPSYFAVQVGRPTDTRGRSAGFPCPLGSCCTKSIPYYSISYDLLRPCQARYKNISIVLMPSSAIVL